MPRQDDAADRVDEVVDRLPLVDDRTTLLLMVVTAAALLARLVILGDRIAHFDEARVAYWSYHFMETGEFHYRYIIHGPFVQHVNALLFAVLGSNDFTMRLVVAVIGGLLPLSVLLFREHLRDAEMVATALFLSFNPILLYYSRFFRSTVPVAAFSLVAFGFLVRLSDTGRVRYLYGATGFLALAFATKENAVVYLVVWIGASALLLDYGLYRPRNARTGLQWLRHTWGDTVSDHEGRRAVYRYVFHLLLAGVLFFVIVLYFYAPRAGGEGGIGLWKSLGAGRLMPLVDATWQDVRAGFEYWLGGALEDPSGYDTIVDRYVDFLWLVLRAIRDYSATLVAFAVFGFAVERYASERGSNLVMFASYWGVVSVLGYPLGTDIKNAWIAVNALVPLAIPAGVGLGLLYRWGRDALEEEDWISVALVVVVLVLVSGIVASIGVSAVYTNSQAPSNGLVQYAQPATDFHPTIRDVRTLAAKNEGVDLFFYGSTLVNRGGRFPPGCTRITNTLPLEWYLVINDVEASCGTSDRALRNATMGGTPPPVVITTTNDAREVSERLPDYEKRVIYLRTLPRYNPRGPKPASPRAVFLDTDRLNSSG
ncbi:MAG: flippase activity-associated protein Agl23 [Halanaeroarchaeum sp.]